MAKEKAPKLTKEEKKERKRQIKEEIKQKKKDGTYNPDDYDDVGGAGLAAVAVIFIILIWLAIFGVLIKMDVGGLGSNIMYPIIKDIPGANMILPDSVQSTSPAELGYAYGSMDEAVARIRELERQVYDYETSGGVNQSRIAELEARIAALQPYKDNVDEFNKTREKFYDEVVFSDKAPDINEYRAYYESINPENAERLYKEAVKQDVLDSRIAEYATAYSTMEPASAAGIFDTMTDNFTLVAKILNAMTPDQRGAILAAMNTENAAALTAMMEPK